MGTKTNTKSIKFIKFTNNEEVFNNLDLLKKYYWNKFYNLKTYTSIIEYLVDKELKTLWIKKEDRE